MLNVRILVYYIVSILFVGSCGNQLLLSTCTISIPFVVGFYFVRIHGVIFILRHFILVIDFFPPFYKVYFTIHMVTPKTGYRWLIWMADNLQKILNWIYTYIYIYIIGWSLPREHRRHVIAFKISKCFRYKSGY